MKNKIFQSGDLCLRALDTNLTCAKSVRGKEEKSMKKSIITVVGKDTVGIIARVCAYLADNNINILDISQTIVQGYFNMMMIVDMNNVSRSSEPLRRSWMRSERILALLSNASGKKFLTRCTESETPVYSGFL